MDTVKAFLISKALLKGDSATTSRPLRHLRGERVSVPILCGSFPFAFFSFHFFVYLLFVLWVRM